MTPPRFGACRRHQPSALVLVLGQPLRSQGQAGHVLHCRQFDPGQVIQSLSFGPQVPLEEVKASRSRCARANILDLAGVLSAAGLAASPDDVLKAARSQP